MTDEPKMEIFLEVRDDLTRRWTLTAKFEYGIHAMEAGRALSVADTREWRGVDHRRGGGPLTITYIKGEAA